MKNRNVTVAIALVLLIGAAYFACSCGVAPLMEEFSPSDTGAVFVYFCFGVILAESAVLAIWGVLGLGPIWIRAPLSFGVGLLLFGCWVLGATVAWGTNAYEMELTPIVLGCLPLAFLAIQSPLWIVRLIFRWELSSINSSNNRERLHAMTIRDIFIATGVIGFALAAARFSQQLADATEAGFWGILAIAVAICFGCSLVSTLPIVFMILRTARISFAVLGLGIYTATWVSIILTVIGTMRFANGWGMIGISITVVTFAMATAAPLGIARWIGFRLRWGRKISNPAK